MKKEYKVTNKGKDERQFRDMHQGKWRCLKPKESVITISPPETNEFWKVEEHEPKEQKITKTKGGMKENG